MRSWQIVEFGRPLRVAEYANPAPQGTEVLLKVDGCGVCHSDLHIWDGYFDLGGGKRFDVGARGVNLPFTLGHEIVGTVAAVGPDATGVAVGDRRIAFPWIGCGACPTCAGGDENLCNNPRFLGTRYAGGYSDRVLVGHPRYLLEYGDVPSALACLYACSGVTAYGALKKVGPLGAGQHVLAIGVGGVGMMGVAIARAMYDAEVIAVDVDPAKLEAARATGAHHAVDARAPDAVKQILKLTGGGAKGAIDFVGGPQTVKFGMDALARGGRLAIVGLFGGELTMSLPLFPFRAISVIGSYVGNLAEMHELMALVRTGKVKPVPYAIRPLDEVNVALDALKAGKITGRTVVTP